MKAIVLIAVMVLMAIVNTAHAMDRSLAAQLISQRNLNLTSLEQTGAQLILGEVTGGGKVLPADRVQVILLQDRAILKREIVGMDFSPVTGKLGDLDSFRVGGLYYTKEDIRGVVIR